jgi:DNA/RNA-binding domain of Phe-tRNA-synthetase-like protein
MNPIKIKISPQVNAALPSLRFGCLLSAIDVRPPSTDLLAQITEAIEETRHTINIGDVSRLPSIRAAKDAYRILGKDPSRYRPSAESLTRRIVQGKGLYKVNNAVDMLNLVSIKYGFSIGGYDAERIEGEIILDTGRAHEPYDAIGRGDLNIEDLPVLRDEQGPFGSPTSDSQRTMVTEHTKTFLMVFFDFGSHDLLGRALEESASLLESHASGRTLRSWIAP